MLFLLSVSQQIKCFIAQVFKKCGLDLEQIFYLPVQSYPSSGQLHSSWEKKKVTKIDASIHSRTCNTANSTALDQICDLAGKQNSKQEIKKLESSFL